MWKEQTIPHVQSIVLLTFFICILLSQISFGIYGKLFFFIFSWKVLSKTYFHISIQILTVVATNTVNNIKMPHILRHELKSKSKFLLFISMRGNLTYRYWNSKVKMLFIKNVKFLTIYILFETKKKQNQNEYDSFLGQFMIC